MIWLVRHPPVALHWQKRCYGISDMGLSREGACLAADIVSKLVAFSPDIIVHSDMRRTRTIAERAADTLSIEAQADYRWRERNFGSWEGCSWNNIYRDTGNAMDGMLSAPETFRPGGGETTAEMVARSLGAWHDLPADQNIAVIAHGGPIAAIMADKCQDGFHLLPNHIAEPGSITRI
ncbi:histidine phosphatase family protein [Parasphingorhabdus sp.]|uniref:histidine phosphatase family protein n=1 Tax=Parasphingorhabdus sp. TaxID=2709688 RepID=UPI0032675805